MQNESSLDWNLRVCEDAFGIPAAQVPGLPQGARLSCAQAALAAAAARLRARLRLGELAPPPRPLEGDLLLKQFVLLLPMPPDLGLPLGILLLKVARCALCRPHAHGVRVGQALVPRLAAP